jgi:hypothetical protein
MLSDPLSSLIIDHLDQFKTAVLATFSHFPDINFLRKFILRDCDNVLHALKVSQSTQERNHVLGSYVKTTFSYAHNTFLRHVFFPVANDYFVTYFLPSHIGEFVIDLERRNQKVAKQFCPHFRFLQKFFVSHCDENGLKEIERSIKGHLTVLLEVMQKYKKIFPADFASVFQRFLSNDQFRRFAAVKLAAYTIDCLKALFVAAFEGTIPAEFLSGNFQANETIPEAFQACVGMNDDEIAIRYPLNAHREEHTRRMSECNRRVSSPVNFDFHGARESMRGNFDAELVLFEAEMRTQMELYYKTKPTKTVLNHRRLLHELEIDLDDEKAALRQQLLTEIDDEVDQLKQSIETKRIALSDELAESTRIAQEAATQTLEAQRRILAKEEKATAGLRRELDALRSEISNYKNKAKQYYDHLDDLVSECMKHVVAEKRAIAEIGNARMVEVGPALTLKRLTRIISADENDEFFTELENDWRKVLKPRRQSRQKSGRARRSEVS